MGLSNKRSKTTESSQSQTAEHSVTSRTNPQWVTDALQGFTNKATGLLDDDPSQYVAPANALQTQAGAAAANLGGWKSLFGQATKMAAANAGATTDRISGESLLDGLDRYTSPYTEKVVDTALADFDAGAGQTRAAQAASAARNGAFGGSRFGVREAATEGELARGRASTEAGLRDQAFRVAAGLSGEDAGRRQQASMSNQQAQSSDLSRQLQAAGLFGQLGNDFGSNARGDIATQAGIGSDLRNIDAEQRQAPIGLLSAVGDLYGQGQFELMNGTVTDGTSNTNSTGTSTTTSTPSLLSSIGQAVKIAAAAASLSDARAKSDIRTLGHDRIGRRWVSYRYLWEGEDEPRHTGVIAQEVLGTDPAAVIQRADGFLAVDYSKLEGSPWSAS